MLLIACHLVIMCARLMKNDVIYNPIVNHRVKSIVNLWDLINCREGSVFVVFVRASHLESGCLHLRTPFSPLMVFAVIVLVNSSRSQRSIFFQVRDVAYLDYVFLTFVFTVVFRLSVKTAIFREMIHFGPFFHYPPELHRCFSVPFQLLFIGDLLIRLSTLLSLLAILGGVACIAA